MKKPNKSLHITAFVISLVVLFNTILTLLTSGSLTYWLDQLFWLPSFLPVIALSFATALLSWAIANRAQKAERSWAAFFWLSALVSPLIMGIIAVTLKPLDSSEFSSSTGSLKSDGPLENKLAELQNLKEKGMLSDAEFDEARKKALGL